MNRAQIEAILELPAADRVAVVQEIWESVVGDAETIPLTTSQREELERRWLDFQASPDEGESWDEVEFRMKKFE
jgi:putative addiction module component (TIGR02574 family)